MKQRITIGLALLICLGALPARAADKDDVAINPRDHRTAIRAGLLENTPMGSTATDVIKFLKPRLQHEGDPEPKIERHPATGPSAKDSEKKGVKVIKINLADYLTNPILLTLDIPMPLRSSLIAQWVFDKNDRLIEIFLDRE